MSTASIFVLLNDSREHLDLGSDLGGVLNKDKHGSLTRSPSSDQSMGSCVTVAAAFCFRLFWQPRAGQLEGSHTLHTQRLGMGDRVAFRGQLAENASLLHYSSTRLAF